MCLKPLDAFPSCYFFDLIVQDFKSPSTGGLQPHLKLGVKIFEFKRGSAQPAGQWASTVNIM